MLLTERRQVSLCVPTSHGRYLCSRWGGEGASVGCSTDARKPMLSVKLTVLEHLLHHLLQPQGRLPTT